MKLVKLDNITIIIVIYQETYELISKTLNSLEDIKIILIDNGNDIDLKKKIFKKFNI